MRKTKQLLTGLLIASISVLSITKPVFASSNMAPTEIPYEYNADKPIPGITVDNTSLQENSPLLCIGGWVDERYYITNKVMNGTARYITKYITPNWSPASSYTLAKGESTTYGLQIGGSKDFAKGIKASLSFTASKSFSASVSTAIPADSSRFSKLTYQCDYIRYNATLWKVARHNAEAPDPAAVKIGRDIVDEPTDDTYAIVVYQ